MVFTPLQELSDELQIINKELNNCNDLLKTDLSEENRESTKSKKENLLKKREEKLERIKEIAEQVRLGVI